MIALDTNVVLLFLTQHDPAQSAQAIALLAGLTERDRGFLCREVVVELVRVLERAYGLPRHDIALALDGLLAARELVVEAPDRPGLAIERYRQGGAGFSDDMTALAARDASCNATFGSDCKAVSHAGMATVPPAT